MFQLPIKQNDACQVSYVGDSPSGDLRDHTQHGSEQLTDGGRARVRGNINE